MFRLFVQSKTRVQLENKIKLSSVCLMYCSKVGIKDVNKKKFLVRVPPRRPPPSSDVPRTGTISDEKRIERTLSDFFTLVLEMDTSGGQEIESVLLDYVLSALEAVKEGRRRRQDFVPNVVEYFIGYLRAEGIELNPTEISMLERLLATLL